MTTMSVQIEQPADVTPAVEYNSAAELAEKMLEILRERGWVRGDVEDCDGKVCLVGSLGLAYGMEPLDGYNLFPNPPAPVAGVVDGIVGYSETFDAARQLVLTRTAMPLWQFNDTYADDVEDVYAALRYVIDHPAEPVSV